MSKYTPGPWVVREHGVENLIDITSETRWIASVALWSYGLVGPTQENEANARLISAAPELVEAAQAALAYDALIQQCANDPGKMASACTAQGEGLDTLYAHWMTLSRAALKKAGVEL